MTPRAPTGAPPSDRPPAPGDRPVVAALFVAPADAEHLTIAALALRDAGLEVVAGGPPGTDLAEYAAAGCTCSAAETAAELVNQVFAGHRCDVLAVGDAVSLPEGFLDAAADLLAADVRVASVSFICNDAGYLSFPHRARPEPRPPHGHDARSVTRRLRQGLADRPPTPVPAPKGPVVLLSAVALGAVGGLRAGPPGTGRSLDYSLAELAARARDRGFVHLLDDTTFVGRHRSPISAPWEPETVDDLHPHERHLLDQEHPAELALLHAEAYDAASPVSLALRLARLKVYGLRVLIDGSYLAASEMGTQVSTLATIDALRRRDDVREVVVALAHPIPPYAEAVLHADKVTAQAVPFDQLDLLGRCDVAHRLVQPDLSWSTANWRRAADRVVITLLDLIGYRIGSYHDSPAEWLRYRDTIRRGVAEADGVTTISADVADQARMDRLPVDPSRLETVALGTEHLGGQEAAEMPAELVARGFGDGPFLLCLGTDYTHKNRDLALATLAELRRRGFEGSLVLAGPTVPRGSSRRAEAERRITEGQLLDRDLYVLPDLASAERNWLMKYAAVVLYPTSAEGFGLVPYEAARFGTPSVFVGFGPLAELAPDIPVTAPDWSADALATATQRLLDDPALARAQVDACLGAATTYTWAATAARLTDLYHRLLARPPR